MYIDPKYRNNFEKKWIKRWEDASIFKSIKDDSKYSYTMIMPPPNITGILHIGHILNNTIQDVLIRRAKMKGYNSCWVPGTDHASIATEKKVIDNLIEKKIIKTKKDISKDEFLSHCRKWADKHNRIIVHQLQSLGIACDWSRHKFTMDKNMNESVKEIFIDLYQKGLIYKSHKMVNWDTKAETTISDEEVLHREVDSKLYYIKYSLDEYKNKFVTIATTRPETIFGDVAVCVNPTDNRYSHLIGKQLIVPVANRKVNIIADEYVDKNFGTGCLKITPAHDVNDNIIGNKHNLETIDILNKDGSLNDNGLHYKGKDRFVVREEIVKELESINALERIENHKNSIGFSERTNSIIESRLSSQWFVKMEKLVIPAIDAIEKGWIKMFPSKFKKTYLNWLNNIRDWNISRQLHWGHPIPAYYYGSGDKDFVVAKNKVEALEKAKKINPNIEEKDLVEERDVLDTWFSSWIFPISVFDGINQPKNEEIEYYYPTKVLVSAPDILFFWIARMVIAGYEFRRDKPFEDIYLTGIVRDSNRLKMSKSLGNSPDPLDLIEEFGADSLRLAVLLTSRAGNDLLFDRSLCIQGRNFCNKIWNSYRLISGWELSDDLDGKEDELMIKFISNKLNHLILNNEKLFSQYKISEALINTYKFVWFDFCSFYLESIKPVGNKKVSKKTLHNTNLIFQEILRILHPFIPFITEELWSYINPNSQYSICISQSNWNSKDTGLELLKQMSKCQEIITEIRKIKKDNKISLKDKLDIIMPTQSDLKDSFIATISNLARVNIVKDGENKKDTNFSTFIVDNEKYKVLIESSKIDVYDELLKLKAKLIYNEGFLKMTEKKLGNENFISNAPKNVIDLELKKKHDTEEKIRILQEEIDRLK